MPNQLHRRFPDDPNRPITFAEARLIMTDMLGEYEREVVEPRHRETQTSLIKIEHLVRERQYEREGGSKVIKGMGGFIGGAVGLAALVLEIVKVARGH